MRASPRAFQLVKPVGGFLEPSGSFFVTSELSCTNLSTSYLHREGTVPAYGDARTITLWTE
jgi:hypothetical protein